MIRLNSFNNSSTHPNYCVISKKCYDANLGQYRTYGIKASTPYTTILHDISTCRETVTHMTTLFNQYQLSPIHLKDAVENMLS